MYAFGSLECEINLQDLLKVFFKGKDKKANNKNSYIIIFFKSYNFEASL